MRMIIIDEPVQFIEALRDMKILEANNEGFTDEFFNLMHNTEHIHETVIKLKHFKLITHHELSNEDMFIMFIGDTINKLSPSLFNLMEPISKYRICAFIANTLTEMKRLEDMGAK